MQADADAPGVLTDESAGPAESDEIRTGPAGWVGRRLWRVAGVVLLIAVAAVLVQRARAPVTPASSQRAANPLVPVDVAAAVRQDIAVRLSALGSVTAFNTVTVKPRVSGQLVQVAFQEGQYIGREGLLARIDQRPFSVVLEQAESQQARDQAQLAEARVELARYQVLIEQDSIARTNVDTQAATVKQLEATVKADQAAIDSAKLNLSFTDVTSPIAGQLGLRQIDVGNLVTAETTPLVVVTEIEPIAVIFTLPEDALRSVLPRIRSRAPMPVDVFDRSGSTHLAGGTLLAVDNQIDQTTGTVRLKAIFENHDHVLFPAQFVNVQIVTDTHRAQLVVPTVAVQQGPMGSFVYVIEDGKAAVRPITTGAVSGEVTSIDGGLDEGARVVVDGADRLRDGSMVDIRNPTSAPAPHPSTP